MINKFLTLVSNMFCNLNVTDMETCYKVFRTDLLKSIPIRSDRFGFEPEITMKCAKRKLRIYEVPISYHGRTYEEGKKIGWKDGVKVFGVILRYWLIDDLYIEPYGRGSLNNMTGTPQYVYVDDLASPALSPRHVLELGAGIGNIAGRMMGRGRTTSPRRRIRFTFTRCGIDFCVRQMFRYGSWTRRHLPTLNRCASPWKRVLCLNVLEYVDDPRKQRFERFADTLQIGGVLLILVPQGPIALWQYRQDLGPPAAVPCR